MQAFVVKETSTYVALVRLSRAMQQRVQSAARDRLSACNRGKTHTMHEQPLSLLLYSYQLYQSFMVGREMAILDG